MDMQNVESSNISAVGHANSTLTVEFKSGAVYEYYGVAASVFEDLVSAPSVGKYFNAVVKEGYSFSKVE